MKKLCLIFLLISVSGIFAQNNQFKKFTLAGTVYDDSTKTVLKDAIIKLRGSDGTVTSVTTDALGKYKFDSTQILPNTSYELAVSNKRYYGAKGKLTTLGQEKSKNFIIDFKLVALVESGDPLPQLRFADGKSELLPQYKDSLEGMIAVLIDNPNVVIEIVSYADLRCSKDLSDSLSFKRAKSVVDYFITKGITGDRLQVRGYGRTISRTLYRETSINGFVFPKGTVLTKEFINQFKDNEAKFEAANQLNDVVEFRILRTDFVPKTNNSNENDIQIIIKKEN